MDFILHLLVAGAVFVIIDAIWLSIVANKYYKKKLAHLLSEKPDFIAAAIFYVIYMVGIIVFVVDPGLKEQSLSFVIGHGALLGLAMYATYDLTNQATIKKWPRAITVLDLAWGTTITTVTSVITYLIFK